MSSREQTWLPTAFPLRFTERGLCPHKGKEASCYMSSRAPAKEAKCLCLRPSARLWPRVGANLPSNILSARLSESLGGNAKRLSTKALSTRCVSISCVLGLGLRDRTELLGPQRPYAVFVFFPCKANILSRLIYVN